MEVIKPPYRKETDNVSIFLAGSIEMGVAEHWQQKVEKALSNLDITIFNPRRDEWDSSWSQSIDNPVFKEQVVWELDHLEKADIIIVYFDKNTKSPISLLEFGLYAKSGKLIVYCPDGFWRKGNVDIVSEKYSLKQVDSFDKLLKEIKIKINYVNI